MAASEWEQAGAVVERLWDQFPDGEIASWRQGDTFLVKFRAYAGPYDGLRGRGPTYVAALIDLGRRWAQEGDDAQ